jgi:hypothetical protein
MLDGTYVLMPADVFTITTGRPVEIVISSRHLEHVKIKKEELGIPELRKENERLKQLNNSLNQQLDEMDGCRCRGCNCG